MEQPCPFLPEKALLRDRMRELRRGHRVQTTPAGRDATAHALLAQLLRHPAWKNVRCPTLYCATVSEAPTHAIHAHCRQHNLLVHLPRVAPGGQLTLHRVAPEMPLVSGAHGIEEPPPDAPRITPCETDFILIPGLAFDFAGHRLGHGHGCYDKLLATFPAEIPRVALAFDWQVLPAIPSAPHDVPVHGIITPTRGLVPW